MMDLGRLKDGAIFFDENGKIYKLIETIQVANRGKFTWRCKIRALGADPKDWLGVVAYKQVTLLEGETRW
jgi:hypothetical protein